jgi:hypothetical protein
MQRRVQIALNERAKNRFGVAKSFLTAIFADRYHAHAQPSKAMTSRLTMTCHDDTAMNVHRDLSIHVNIFTYYLK